MTIADEKIIGGKRLVSIYGVSTDSKPTTDIATGSSFICVDNGKVYLYNEAATAWVEQS